VSELPDPGAVGAAFEEFMRAMSLVAEQRESEVAVRLREHLGTDPKALPTTGTEFSLTEHANLQLALDAVLVDADLLGFAIRPIGFGSSGLAEIVAGEGMAGPVSFGPVRYVDVEVGDGRVIQCVESGLFLIMLGQSKDGAEDGQAFPSMRHALYAAGLPIPPSVEID
jgi:hypothetical protein